MAHRSVTRVAAESSSSSVDWEQAAGDGRLPGLTVYQEQTRAEAIEVRAMFDVLVRNRSIVFDRDSVGFGSRRHKAGDGSMMVELAL
jgi:hypothetical protein